MHLKKRRLGLAAAVFTVLALFVWARALASWRPQKIGVYPNAVLVEDLTHGPWILSQKQLINVESGHRTAVPASAREWTQYRFSPDGRSFAFSTELQQGDGTFWSIEWHDCASGRLLGSFDEFLGSYAKQPGDFKFRFSSDGKNLVVVADDGVDFLPLDGSQGDFFKMPNGWSPLDPLSRDGNWLFVPEVTDHPQRGSKIYDLKRRRLQSKIQMKLKWISGVDFAPDGTSVLVNNINPWSHHGPRGPSETWMHDVQTGRRLWDFERSFPPSARVGDFCFSPDGQRLVVFYAENTSFYRELHATRTGKLIRQLPPMLGKCVFAPDGNFLYCLRDGMLWKIRVR